MNYFIIGGDGKQYGPITDADVRQWIAEGRLNGQSMARTDSAPEFRPLSAFPEFASALGAPPPLAGLRPSPGAAPDGREAALRKIKVPATGLIVTASIGLVLGVFGAIHALVSPPDLQQMDSEIGDMSNQYPQMQQFLHQFSHIMHVLYGPVGSVVTQVFQLIVAALILAAAIKMRSLKSYEFAMTAAVLSLIPCLTECCTYPLGLVFGIWAIAVLTSRDVKPHFT